MVRFGHSELRAFSKAIEDVYAPVNDLQLPRHFYDVLKRFFVFDYFAYHEIYSDRPQRAVIYPDYPFDFAAFTTYLHQHPSWMAFTAGGAQGVLRITDLVTLSEWQKTDLYNLIFRPRQQDHQIGFIDSSAEPRLGIALNRAVEKFSDKECVALDLLRPHLVQALQLARVSGEFPAAADKQVPGYLEIDSRGRITQRNEKAAALLKEYFGLTGSELPGAIRTWLSKRQLGFRTQFAAGSDTLTLAGGGKNLMICIVSSPLASTQRLTLRESNEARQSASLQELGLTPRESEVLLWTSRGKQNSEIAIILGIRTRTVTKHLERVFVKLGVESRTAASQVVHDISFRG